MRKYCKAYHLKDFRQFSGWTEQRTEQEPEPTDDDIGYLWDDFIVVRSPVQEQGVIFDHVTPAWQEFCKTTLHFEIPEDLRYAYENDASSERTDEQSEAAV